MSPKNILLISIFLLWITGVAWGFVLVLRYEYKPGVGAQAPSSLTQQTGKKTLILLIHPRCPCSRVTLAELEKIMARGNDCALLHVYFFQPSDRPLSWSQSDTWNWASQLPGAQVHADLDGRKAKELGAATSGQVLLYDETGKLLFSGGITVGRGHQGDNAGSQTVLDLLQGGAVSTCDFPVFGCPLFDPATSCCEGSSSCRN